MSTEVERKDKSKDVRPWFNFFLSGLNYNFKVAGDFKANVQVKYWINKKKKYMTRFLK